MPCPHCKRVRAHGVGDARRQAVGTGVGGRESVVSREQRLQDGASLCASHSTCPDNFFIGIDVVSGGTCVTSW